MAKLARAAAALMSLALLLLPVRICTAETAPVQPGTAARAHATAKSATGAVCAGSPRTLLATVPVWVAQRPLSARRATFAETHGNEREAPKPAARLSWVARVKPTPSFLQNSPLGPFWASSHAPGGVWLLPFPNTHEVCDNTPGWVLTLRRICSEGRETDNPSRSGHAAPAPPTMRRCRRKSADGRQDARRALAHR